MGKKPVVAFIGLVWAGIALTGCGKCCQQCRNGSCGSPTTTASPGTNPSYGSPMTPMTPMTPPMVGDARPVTPNNNATFSGSTNSQLVQPVNGTTTPITSAVAPTQSPTTQQSLSAPTPQQGPLHADLPKTGIDDGLGATPVSHQASETRRIPPVPVVPRNTTSQPAGDAMPPLPGTANDLPPLPATSGEVLPPLSGSSSALPPLPE